MKKFIVSYDFDGNGEVEIEADSEEQAREKFFDGQFENEQEWGEDYAVRNIEPKEIK
jgi:hypothetical protein